MQITANFPSFNSFVTHTKLAYSYIKLEKTLAKVSPATLAPFCYLAQFSRPLWSVHSLFKLRKFAHNKSEDLSKNSNWLEKGHFIFIQTVDALKKVTHVMDILQYNLIFLAAYRALGREAPFSDNFVMEMGTLPFVLAPYKLLSKGNAYCKAETKWCNETNPKKLTQRKWSFIHAALLYSAASFYCIYWTAVVAHKFFPTLQDPSPYGKCIDLAVYSLKFGAILAKTYSIYQK